MHAHGRIIDAGMKGNLLKLGIVTPVNIDFVIRINVIWMGRQSTNTCIYSADQILLSVLMSC